MNLISTALYLAGGTLTALLLEKSAYKNLAPPTLTPLIALTAWPIILPTILALRLKDLHTAIEQTATAAPKP